MWGVLKFSDNEFCRSDIGGYFRGQGENIIPVLVNIPFIHQNISKFSSFSTSELNQVGW